MPRTRIFFTTDVHGSERCFIKFLNAGQFYKADCIILGGDITFKAIVPLVRKGDGKVYARFLGENYVLSSENEVKLMEKRVRSIGFYPYQMSEEEYREYLSNKRMQDELFERLVVEMIKRWVSLAEEKLRDKNFKCFISPGNDDSRLVDEYLKSSKYIIYPEEQVVKVDSYHEMITLGVSNITPWHCIRDVEENVIEEKIEKLVSQVSDIKNCIFNIHVPPYGTPLDLAPKLDENLKPSPLSFKDFLTFSIKSRGYAIEAVATYGILWAAKIFGTSFLCSLLPFMVVVVQAPYGVALLLWIPVFW